MKASLWQAGLPAGLSRQAAPGRQAAKGFGGRTISSLPSFPLVFLCAGGRSKREWGGGKVFKEDPGEKKAEIPSPWISNCLSREVSLRTLLGFREGEKKNQGRGWAGGWREGPRAPLGRGWGSGPSSQPPGQRQRTDVQVARDVGRR